MKAILALMLVAVLTACASGTVLLTGKARTPISPDDVVLYTTAPAHYEVIGIVNAHNSHGWTDQGRLEKAVAELKSQAAGVGANGIILQGVSTNSSGAVGVGVPTGGGGMVFAAGGGHDQAVSGTAIYVTAQ